MNTLNPTHHTNDIEIYRTASGWVASFTHDSDRAEMIRLFGTTEIPTPFCADAVAQTVLVAVQHNNPGKTVGLR